MMGVDVTEMDDESLITWVNGSDVFTASQLEMNKRLKKEIFNLKKVVSSLNTIVKKNSKATNDSNIITKNQNHIMIWLTIVITILTIANVGLLVYQIWFSG